LAFIPSECYRRNLAALAGFQPDVAAAVEATVIPPHVHPAAGRDGSDTFLFRSESGRPRWFGGSSMPTISAPETLAGFLSDGRNLALPGVCTGLEPLVVAGRMPQHTALFVLERSALHLKLAMQLYDYASWISAGRFVFVLGRNGDLAEGLYTFFQQHPGFELPTQLLTSVARKVSEIAELQTLLEQAGRAVSELHAGFVRKEVETLRRRRFGPLPNPPRIAVLGLDPRPVSLEHARRIARGLAELGWPYELCIPDSPCRCHVAARLQTVSGVSADLVIMVSGIAGSMSALLPEELPVACWYLPEAVVQAINPEELRPSHTVFACAQSIHDALLRAGVPGECIEHCGPAADSATHHPVSLPPGDTGPARMDVAVLADLPDDRPEACNIDLASHVTLWRALQEVVRREADRYHPDIAPELLDEAQRRCGTTVEDSKIREHFVGLLRTRIAPAVIARVAVEALNAERYVLGIWGSNWPVGSGKEGQICGAIPIGDALNRIFNASGIVLIPDPSPIAVQRVLDALAAGAKVVCRRTDGPFERQYPDLADLEPHLHLYRTTGELLQNVRGMKNVELRTANERRTDSSSSPFAIRASALPAVVRREHGIAQRLKALVETVRRREALPAQAG
jgi:hypothetical protein